MADKNEYLQEAAHTIYEVNSDRIIREQCIRRREYDSLMNYYKNTIVEKENAIAKQNILIAQKDAEIAALKARLQKE